MQLCFWIHNFFFFFFDNRSCVRLRKLKKKNDSYKSGEYGIIWNKVVNLVNMAKVENQIKSTQLTQQNVPLSMFKDILVFIKNIDFMTSSPNISRYFVCAPKW